MRPYSTRSGVLFISCECTAGEERTPTVEAIYHTRYR
jgi:hypothetical protein